MKQLTLLIPEGPSNLSAVAGAYMIFTRADQYWQEIGNKPVFNVTLAGKSKEIDLYMGLFSIRPKIDINDISKTDLIIIPAIQPGFSFTEAIRLNQWMTSWVTDQHNKGAEIACICTGAFLLAPSGLLNGKNCSTHWLAANSFHQLFPEVNLVTDKLITSENGIYTSGGAFSFLNFLLYLIEKYYSRQTAIFCSKVFEIDIDRDSQSPFIVFAGQKNHMDESIIQAQTFIENNFFDRISIDELASRFSIGRRNFDRRFKTATGNSPLEYLQRVKIEAAKMTFESTRKTVKEVMFDVGYSDFKAFRTIFRKITGLTPQEYRNKYNREIMVA